MSLECAAPSGKPIPLTLLEVLRFDFGRVSSLGWAGLVYLAAFPSLLAVALLGENVTYSVITGGGLVPAGGWFTERGR